MLEALEPAMKRGQRSQTDRAAGQTTMFGIGLLPEATEPTLELPDVPAAAEAERRRWEKELLGLYVTPSPLSDPAIGEQLAANVDARIYELEDTHHGQTMTIGGIVSNLRSFMTRKGQMMGAVTLEDLPGAIEVICFPRIWQRISPELSNDRVVLATGRIEGDDASPRMLADNLYPLSAAASDGDAAASANGDTDALTRQSDYQDSPPMPADDETSADFYVPEPVPEPGNVLAADEEAPSPSTGASEDSAEYEPEAPPDQNGVEPATAAANGSSSPAPADPPEQPTPSGTANGTDSVVAPSAPGDGPRGASNGTANGAPPEQEADEPVPAAPAAPPPLVRDRHAPSQPRPQLRSRPAQAPERRRHLQRRPNAPASPRCQDRRLRRPPPLAQNHPARRITPRRTQRPIRQGQRRRFLGPLAPRTSRSETPPATRCRGNCRTPRPPAALPRQRAVPQSWSAQSR